MKGDAIADLVLAAFRALPAKAKPRVLPNGLREWTPLSGIVVTNVSSASSRCVALGTGMRCLSASKLPLAKGNCLHDWHAEIVAIRAFNHYLLSECARLAEQPSRVSEIIRVRNTSERTQEDFQLYAIKDDVEIAMFCSEAPCGDASMELTMSAQEDASPWTSPSMSEKDGMLQSGRGHFAELGTVRRKPSRADAPPTLSKSCSDKLAMKQCTSLLSSTVSLLIEPGNAYLHQLVLPETQLVPTAIERAFSPTGRMRSIAESSGIWSGAYSFKAFTVTSHNRTFDFAKPLDPMTRSKGSNIAAVWTSDLSEVLIGGTKQGYRQFSDRGKSAISCLGLLDAAKGVAEASGDIKALEAFASATSYSVLKDHELLASRRGVKHLARLESLMPWPRNSGDDFPIKSG